MFQRSRRERVRSVLRDRWTVEDDDDRGSGWRPSRVAVVAQWSATPRLSKSTCQLVKEFSAAEFDVVVVSACEDPRPLEWSDGRPGRLLVLRKPNIGYDFGSWSIALQARPQIAEAEHVVLANDSMAGPFLSMQSLLSQFLTTQSDVWALTDTTQFGHHLQSYFIGFRNHVLADAVLHRFWFDVRVERSKDDVIRRGEIALSRMLHQEGYVTEAAFPYRRFAPDSENPAIMHWCELLHAGFPFLKRELIARPEVAPAASTAAAVVRDLFGQELLAWL
jgi:Rhamnan synthesis protein F